MRVDVTAVAIAPNIIDLPGSTAKSAICHWDDDCWHDLTAVFDAPSVRLAAAMGVAGLIALGGLLIGTGRSARRECAPISTL